MIKVAYSVSANVYAGKVNKTDAIVQLKKKGWNKTTASNYIRLFKNMMDGELYKTLPSEEAVNYFLTHITNDYGLNKLNNALKATRDFVNYYESLDKKDADPIKKIFLRYESSFEFQLVIIYPDELNEPELDAETALFEGDKKTISVNIYERSKQARTKCIKEYGLQCVVCGFDFEKVYGDIGKGFIHVHHLTPLSNIGQSKEVNYVEDLRPVCPNCHAMLHKKNPPYTIDDLTVWRSELAVEVLEKQITELDNESFSKLRDWFIEFEQSRWEKQIEADSNAGKLDFLIDAALAEHQAGKTRNL
jgi:5-methylcytosine-specific restriction protein A